MTLLFCFAIGVVCIGGLTSILFGPGLLYYPNGEAKNLIFLLRHLGSIEDPYSNYSLRLSYYTTPVARQKIFIFCFAIGVVQKVIILIIH